jgi:hypothetical protein
MTLLCGHFSIVYIYSEIISVTILRCHVVDTTLLKAVFSKSLTNSENMFSINRLFIKETVKAFGV